MCTMKLETTTLAAIHATQRQTTTGFFLLIHCDISVTAVHPPHPTPKDCIFLKMLAMLGQQYQMQHKRFPDIGVTGWEELPDQGGRRIIIPRKVVEVLWKSLVLLHARKMLGLCIFFNK